MTFDEWVVLIGTIAAVIAAIAGIVAAIFAIRGDRFGRASRRHDLQPRPKVRWLEQGQLSFYNVGAAAHHLVWLGVARGRLYAAFASLPPEFGDYMPIGTADLADLPGSAEDRLKSLTETVVLVARDIEGRWWDCIRNERLPQRPIREQLSEMLKALGLDSAGDRIFAA